MERLTVIKSRRLAGQASLDNILKTVDNIFANRCSRRLGRPIFLARPRAATSANCMMLL